MPTILRSALMTGLLCASGAVFCAQAFATDYTAPDAFHRFCEREPAECQAQGEMLRQMPLTEALWQELKTVNRHFNRGVREVSDQRQHRREDVWSIAVKGGAGDCEDFALAKRQELIARGWPSSTLLLAVVRTRRGEGHAVLIARTTAGDLVLDNWRRGIRRVEETGYRFYGTQSQDDPARWVAVPRQGPVPIVSSAIHTSG